MAAVTDEKLTDSERGALERFVKEEWDKRGAENFNCGDVAAKATCDGVVPGKTICFMHVSHIIRKFKNGGSDVSKPSKKGSRGRQRGRPKKTTEKVPAKAHSEPQITEVVELDVDREAALIVEILNRMKVLSEAGRQYLNARLKVA